MKDIKHVQLEASAFLSDIDFQLMDAEQRGVYCSIIFYLYANGGFLSLNNTDITLLSNKSSKLAIISNCQKCGIEWERIWNSMSHKFKIENNLLTHKRVTEELKKASEFKKKKSEAGKKGMDSRWNADNTDITNISKDNLNKGNNNKYSPNSDEFKLASLLLELIKKRKPDFKEPNIQSWAVYIDRMVRIDKRKPNVIEEVIRWCQKDDFWQNNILSTDKLRKQFDKLELKKNAENNRQCSINRTDIEGKPAAEFIR